jgi:hypothetical protein
VPALADSETTEQDVDIKTTQIAVLFLAPTPRPHLKFRGSKSLAGASITTKTRLPTYTRGFMIGQPYVTALTLNRLAAGGAGTLIGRLAGNHALPAEVRRDIIDRNTWPASARATSDCGG